MRIKISSNEESMKNKDKNKNNFTLIQKRIFINIENGDKNYPSVWI